MNLRLNRRRFISLSALTPLLVLIGCAGEDAEEPSATGTQAGAASQSQSQATAAATSAASPAQLPATPACGDDDDEPTVAQTEGPYFTPNSPERSSLLETGMADTKLTLEGFVLSTSCQPVARALVDFWQADDSGEYDNSGYRLRGHIFTGADGSYRLETILPGLYPGRTRHIHVKVQAPNRPVLTTQLYFPGETRNSNDGIFDSELVIEMRDLSDGRAGNFNFVLQV